MDIQLISYVLALVVGGLALLLVRRTTNEFDRWYTDDDYRQRVMNLPTTLISLIAVFGALAVFTRIR